MKLEISHITRYTYLDPVQGSVNEIRLTPRSNYRQSCYHHQIVTEPPSNMFTYEDFFHNRVHSFTVDKPHRELLIKMISTVVTHANDNTQQTTMSPEEERQIMQQDTFQNKFIEYLLPTSYTEFTPEIKAYSNRIPDTGISISDLIESIYTTINLDFVYDPYATSVQTTVGEMLKIKRGVCQDYTHFMIAICREKGIPARYVSGYHFVGDLQGGNADFTQASHAWVECYIPGTSCWFGYDPTNNCPLDWRYIKLGHGRDYNDIVPVKGVYRGSSFQNLEVTVDVRLVEGA
ncbi:transglutaminase family protein [Paenibacillus sp. GP183]|jgi:transglutaminase-like putative cysteine protease|uniref:transglutaminase family protein n=1 Tax=Paenibacillus sp. GP183 TaxID=1882751 RepID=UPI0008970F44|nr:transglutaminase family protein [Paenibacillus sp. GP183]SEB94643.1 Transglutaminase-like enzyme, putative cysteine protease [Paenibacillus sp. GP183]